MPARSEWAPLSLRLVTVKVLSKLRSSITSSAAGPSAAKGWVLIWGAGPGRRAVVDRRNQDADNMMQAFLEENRSA